MVRTKSTSSALKPLNPRSPDLKYTGNEPEWRVQPTEGRISKLTEAFTWYNYHYGKKDAKDLIVAWLEQHDRPKDAKKIRSIPDSQIRLTPAWLCRMNMMGLELTDHEQISLDDRIKEMLSYKEQAKVEVVEEDTGAPKITIQDRLREKVSECAGELEGMFDDFLADGAKMSATWKPIAQIRGMNIAPQMVNDIAVVWKAKLAEYEEVAEGKDAQLVEGYSNFSKIQIRNIIKFCETVINDCGAYVQIKKVERKPRKAKPISPEKRAAKFKYCAKFDELKLTSLHPKELVDKSEAWLYDTKKRKLIHLVADPHVGAFTLKNNSVIGFSTIESQQKTLRKPADVLKQMTTAGKPAARKVFKDIKATETVFNGRGTENIVILRSW